MFREARRIIEKVNADRRLLLLLLVINVAGTLVGLYYYWDQLMMTPWYLWLAVPDCPLYTLLMAIALALIIVGRPWGTFNAITAVGASMYGTWTVLVLLYFGEIFFSPALASASWERLISHAGMALESLLLLPYLTKIKPVSWAITAAWFFVLDAVDYFYYFVHDGLPLRTHPLAPLEYFVQGNPGQAALLSKIDSLLYVTFGLTIVFFVAMIVLSKAYDRNSHDAIQKESPGRSRVA